MVLNDTICTLYFLGKQFEIKETVYPHKYDVPNTDEGISKLFKKIQASDYMPALCVDGAGNRCSRAVINDQSAKFCETNVIVIDCDGKISIEDFKKIAEPYHYFLITTRSHGVKSGDHFRVGFPLGETITDESVYLDYLNKIIMWCKGDKSCSDPVRMFFASGSDAVYDYHKGKSVLEWLTAFEELSKMPETQDEESDAKTLEHWYGLTLDETKKHFLTCSEGERNAHLFGATGHLIISLKKEAIETLSFIEECNNAFHHPKNWREERPKIVKAIKIWQSRRDKIEQEKLRIENKYNLDDIDLALFLADAIRDDFRWCEEHGIWYSFDKGIWVKDYGLRIHEACKQAMKKRIEVGKMKLKEMKRQERKIYIEKLKKLLNYNKRTTIIKDARPILSIFAKDFDCKDTLLNFTNGTYNLDDECFYEHDRAEYHTKMCACKYDPSEKVPKRFIDFLEEIFQGDFELIEYVQKLFGLCLTGKVDRQEFYILHGGGGNGKSVLISIFTKLVDEYAMVTDADKLMQSYGNKDTYLALFKNKRALFCFEPKKGGRLDVPLIKLLTGGEPLMVAQKYEVPEKIELKLKPFLITNPKPKINETDNAIWRRVRMLPFNFEVQDDKRIFGLENIILDCGKSGIMNWFINGYCKYKKDGLKTPESVKVKTEEYRDESDDVKNFIDDCCDLGNDFCVSSSVLFNAYLKWSKLPKYDQPSQKGFSNDLTKKGYNKKEIKSRIYFTGIRLSINEENSFEDRI